MFLNDMYVVSQLLTKVGLEYDGSSELQNLNRNRYLAWYLPPVLRIMHYYRVAMGLLDENEEREERMDLESVLPDSADDVRLRDAFRRSATFELTAEVLDNYRPRTLSRIVNEFNYTLGATKKLCLEVERVVKTVYVRYTTHAFVVGALGEHIVKNVYELAPELLERVELMKEAEGPDYRMLKELFEFSKTFALFQTSYEKYESVSDGNIALAKEQAYFHRKSTTIPESVRQSVRAFYPDFQRSIETLGVVTSKLYRTTFATIARVTQSTSKLQVMNRRKLKKLSTSLFSDKDSNVLEWAAKLGYPPLVKGGNLNKEIFSFLEWLLDSVLPLFLPTEENPGTAFLFEEGVLEIASAFVSDQEASFIPVFTERLNARHKTHFLDTTMQNKSRAEKHLTKERRQKKLHEEAETLETRMANGEAIESLLPMFTAFGNYCDSHVDDPEDFAHLANYAAMLVDAFYDVFVKNGLFLFSPDLPVDRAIPQAVLDIYKVVSQISNLERTIHDYQEDIGQESPVGWFSYLFEKANTAETVDIERTNRENLARVAGFANGIAETLSSLVLRIREQGISALERMWLVNNGIGERGGLQNAISLVGQSSVGKLSDVWPIMARVLEGTDLASGSAIAWKRQKDNALTKFGFQQADLAEGYSSSPEGDIRALERLVISEDGPYENMQAYSFGAELSAIDEKVRNRLNMLPKTLKAVLEKLEINKFLKGYTEKRMDNKVPNVKSIQILYPPKISISLPVYMMGEGNRKVRADIVESREYRTDGTPMETLKGKSVHFFTMWSRASYIMKIEEHDEIEKQLYSLYLEVYHEICMLVAKMNGSSPVDESFGYLNYFPSDDLKNGDAATSTLRHPIGLIIEFLLKSVNSTSVALDAQNVSAIDVPYLNQHMFMKYMFDICAKVIGPEIDGESNPYLPADESGVQELAIVDIKFKMADTNRSDNWLDIMKMSSFTRFRDETLRLEGDRYVIPPMEQETYLAYYLITAVTGAPFETRSENLYRFQKEQAVRIMQAMATAPSNSRLTGWISSPRAFGVHAAQLALNAVVTIVMTLALKASTDAYADVYPLFWDGLADTFEVAYSLSSFAAFVTIGSSLFALFAAPVYESLAVSFLLRGTGNVLSATKKMATVVGRAVRYIMSIQRFITSPLIYFTGSLVMKLAARPTATNWYLLPFLATSLSLPGVNILKMFLGYGLGKTVLRYASNVVVPEIMGQIDVSKIFTLRRKIRQDKLMHISARGGIMDYIRNDGELPRFIPKTMLQLQVDPGRPGSKKVWLLNHVVKAVIENASTASEIAWFLYFPGTFSIKTAGVQDGSMYLAIGSALLGRFIQYVYDRESDKVTLLDNIT